MHKASKNGPPKPNQCPESASIETEASYGDNPAKKAKS